MPERGGREEEREKQREEGRGRRRTEKEGEGEVGKGEKGGGESEFPMASVTSFHKLKGLIQHTFILPQLSSAARSGESVS